MQHNATFYQDLQCLLSLKLLTVTPESTKCAITCVLYQYVWGNQSEYKRTNNVKDVCLLSTEVVLSKVCIMLINFKKPTIVGILAFMSDDKFRAQLS